VLEIRRALVLPALAASGALVVVAAGAVAAVETDTVSSFPRALWWAISLITTVGFIGDPPHSVAGELLSAALMIFGFFLLALISAGLASLFVQHDEHPVDVAERRDLDTLLAEVARLHARLDALQGATARDG
jgi:voltage-gated potassium channel